MHLCLSDCGRWQFGAGSKWLVQCGSIVVLCLLNFNPNAINRSEFAFDDQVAIARNSDVTNITRPITETIQKIYRHDFWGSNITSPKSHKSYRPLVTLTFNLEHRAYHRDRIAVNMKWTNLWLHCVVSCLLLNTLPKILHGINGNTVWLTSAMFAVHPVHTEAVCGIVGRADLLCALFYMLSINCFATILSKHNANRSSVWTLYMYILVFSLTSLAVMSKEIGITILPFCIVYDVINASFSEKSYEPVQLRRFYPILFRCFVLAIFTVKIALIRLFVIDFQSPTFQAMDNPVGAADDQITKILSQQFLYSLNFWLMICPNWLCFDWSFNSIDLVKTILDSRIIAFVLFDFLLIRIVLTRSRNVLVAVAMVLIPFLPATGIVRVGFVIAERILYIPSIGYCILVCIGFDRIKQKYPQICCFFAIFVCLVFIAKTNQRAMEWTNEEQLYKSALRVCPNNAKVYYNIGRLASQNGDETTAMNYYKYAIKLYPNYDAALMNLGNLYRAQNQLDLAEQLIEKSIQITEEFPTAWMNLGIVKATKGRHNEALSCYMKALTYRRNYHTCLYNLGNLYLEMKNYSLALKSWKHSLEIDPEQSRAWANMLTLLDSEGNIDQVVEVSATALQFLPNDTSIMFLRANAFGKLDRFIEAEQLYTKIIQAAPTVAIYHVNLGVLYHRWRRESQAIDSYRNAIRIDPNQSNANKYINQLLSKARNELN